MKLLTVAFTLDPATLRVESETTPGRFYTVRNARSVWPQCECWAARYWRSCKHEIAAIEVALEGRMTTEETTAIVPVSAGAAGMAQLALSKRLSLAEQTAGWGYALELGRGMFVSRLLPLGINSPEAAALCIVMATDLNIPASAAFKFIAVINGRPTLMANMVGALIERSQKGYVAIEKLDRERAEVRFVRYASGAAPQRDYLSTFSMEDAKAASLNTKTGPWKDGYVPNMLYARAVTNGAWRMFPDVLMGLDVFAAAGEDGQVLGPDGEPAEYIDTTARRVADDDDSVNATAADMGASEADRYSAALAMIAENGWKRVDLALVVGDVVFDKHHAKAALMDWLRFAEEAGSADPVAELEERIFKAIYTAEEAAREPEPEGEADDLPFA